ncbi:MAG: flagellar modification protein B [Candidatus Lambdaproteobacteria bacterium RIFOXYD1_FULL_56_27]|uniref:Flagellar modification protein B n=1 Tax=Candidatus Lambdaproteobacteria bacterium RIFOXYD2_FULL_56_26 TaxID=1817773 RepID=A0A1F6GS84_9PROT|nr:MAG: flagellar modification protein B [Candidatus Lambdaproteobacteria bacterium RIFOXYD2_FULL_56_26]OGH01326.1 MAG: flagellar modification protein B [Candidatus Lambdaproteobacteria bacterium RIFOXYC1_FULL_56_13]OGH06866.1 MAG: flagellar modification protein B [Candidatus Lambdaproteobacteria bacterium RIFOXYD1_FULL_56_27]
MKRLCTISARGGSKGVKGKNLKDLAGKPLLAHSIAQAKESGLFELIAVNSDSAEILEAGLAWGADLALKRPPEMATDTAPKLPAIQWGGSEVERLSGLTFDTFVDLDATSPLRLASDIIGSVELLESQGADNVITGAPARRSPYFNLVELGSDGVVRLAKVPERPIVRRQDAPRCFDMNASIYVWNRQSFFHSQGIFLPKTLLFEMPEERSQDIDSDLDFKIVKLLLEARGSE